VDLGHHDVSAASEAGLESARGRRVVVTVAVSPDVGVAATVEGDTDGKFVAVGAADVGGITQAGAVGGELAHEDVQAAGEAVLDDARGRGEVVALGFPRDVDVAAAIDAEALAHV